MEHFLRTTPSYEQLIEELGTIKKKILTFDTFSASKIEENTGIEIEKKSLSEGFPFYSESDNKNTRKEDLDILYKVELAEANAKLNKEIIEKKLLKQELENIKKELSISNQKNHKLTARTEKLVAINKALKSSNADLENFIYSSSHDLRSPISNLEGLVQILTHELGDRIQDSQRSLISMIETSISRFKQTILDLTEITKFQKDEQEVQEPVLFEEIIEDVKSNINNKIQESGAEIETDLKVTQVNFSRKNLRSVIFNLLINAVKYRSPKRPLKLQLSSYKKGKNIVFEVKDNGLGFLPEQKEKLFEMFKRLHTHVEGTGVGLYIVKKIIENSGGNIKVESHLDEGSTFKIFLKA